MLTPAAQASFTALDRRFVLSAFLPTVFFAGLTTITLWPSVLTAWQRQPGATQIVWAVAFAASALLVSSVLANLSTPILRWYEGYWRGPIARLGRAHHARRLGRAPYSLVYQRYPLPSSADEAQPTTLGNVLRNAELHARDRYDLDAVVVWPRLFLIAPDHVRASVGVLRGELEMLLNVCTLAGLYGVIAGVRELVADGPWWRFPLVFGVPMVVGMLAYLASVAVAGAYGEQIKSVFDTYRLELLEKVDPDNPAAENVRWYRLAQLWYRAIPTGTALEPDDGTAAPAEPPTGRVPRLSVWFGLLVVVLTVLGTLATA